MKASPSPEVKKLYDNPLAMLQPKKNLVKSGFETIFSSKRGILELTISRNFRKKW